jgi:hypothetical protein
MKADEADGLLDMRAETIPRLVGDHAVGMHSYGNDVFLRRNGIFIIPLAVDKLLKSGHLVVNSFLLRLYLAILFAALRFSYIIHPCGCRPY